MKFTPLLISAALAIVASAAPLSNQNVNAHANVDTTQMIHKRCADCTKTDSIALDLIVKSAADHYAEIAQARLDSLGSEIQTAKVTSGSEELHQEKIALTVTVQSKIDAAKKACSSDELAPIIKATVAADDSMDIPWSQTSKDQVEQKLIELNIKVTQLVVDRIQSNIKADALSKECTEKITNTEIAPAPAEVPLNQDSVTSPPADAPAADVVADAPAAVPETSDSTVAVHVDVGHAGSESQDSTSNTVAEPVAQVTADDVPNDGAVSGTSAQPCEDSSTTGEGLRAGIDVAAESVDPKFVCKSGCVDSEDAKNVLTLRVNLEGILAPRIDHFVQQEVPSDCNDKQTGLLDSIVNLLDGLRVHADVETH